MLSDIFDSLKKIAEGFEKSRNFLKKYKGIIEEDIPLTKRRDGTFVESPINTVYHAYVVKGFLFEILKMIKEIDSRKIREDVVKEYLLYRARGIICVDWEVEKLLGYRIVLENGEEIYYGRKSVEIVLEKFFA